jgi:phosphoribosylanthranilate isomerase
VRTRIKICCIESHLEASMAVRAGADAIGLVGEMPSGPGVIGDALAADIASALAVPVASFLLSARTTGSELADHANACGTQAIQVVKHIEPTAHRELAREAPRVRRVQVIHVEDAASLGLMDAYASYVDAYLLDSGSPNTHEFGGTGRTHDWSISAEFVRRSKRPVFLAGGLHARNVAAAIATVRPYGVDVCSGVRTGGALDESKLHAFVRAVYEADAAGASATA